MVNWGACTYVAINTAAANAGNASKLLSWYQWARFFQPLSCSSHSLGLAFAGDGIRPPPLALPVPRYGNKAATNTHQNAILISFSFRLPRQHSPAIRYRL